MIYIYKVFLVVHLEQTQASEAASEKTTITPSSGPPSQNLSHR